MTTIEKYEGEQITKELLDTIKVGDKIMCYKWKKYYDVVGVSDNYFIMSGVENGENYYSHCEKKPALYDKNNVSKGDFRISIDNRIFGSEYGYDFSNSTVVEKTLNALENGELKLSERNAVPLIQFRLKRS